MTTVWAASGVGAATGPDSVLHAAAAARWSRPDLTATLGRYAADLAGGDDRAWSIGAGWAVHGRAAIGDGRDEAAAVLREIPARRAALAGAAGARLRTELAGVARDHGDRSVACRILDELLADPATPADVRFDALVARARVSLAGAEPLEELLELIDVAADEVPGAGATATAALLRSAAERAQGRNHTAADLARRSMSLLGWSPDRPTEPTESDHLTAALATQWIGALMDAGAWSSARRAADEIVPRLDVAATPSRQLAQLRLTWARATTRPATTVAALTRAADDAAASGAPDLEAACRTALAELHESAGRPDEARAESVLQAAAERTDRERAARFRAVASEVAALARQAPTGSASQRTDGDDGGPRLAAGRSPAQPAGAGAGMRPAPPARPDRPAGDGAPHDVVARSGQRPSADRGGPAPAARRTSGRDAAGSTPGEGRHAAPAISRDGQARRGESARRGDRGRHVELATGGRERNAALGEAGAGDAGVPGRRTTAEQRSIDRAAPERVDPADERRTAQSDDARRARVASTDGAPAAGRSSRRAGDNGRGERPGTPVPPPVRPAAAQLAPGGSPLGDSLLEELRRTGSLTKEQWSDPAESSAFQMWSTDVWADRHDVGRASAPAEPNGTATEGEAARSAAEWLSSAIAEIDRVWGPPPPSRAPAPDPPTSPAAEDAVEPCAVVVFDLMSGERRITSLAARDVVQRIGRQVGERLPAGARVVDHEESIQVELPATEKHAVAAWVHATLAELDGEPPVPEGEELVLRAVLTAGGRRVQILQEWAPGPVPAGGAAPATPGRNGAQYRADGPGPGVGVAAGAAGAPASQMNGRRRRRPVEPAADADAMAGDGRRDDRHTSSETADDEPAAPSSSNGGRHRRAGQAAEMSDALGQSGNGRRHRSSAESAGDTDARDLFGSSGRGRRSRPSVEPAGVGGAAESIGSAGAGRHGRDSSGYAEENGAVDLFGSSGDTHRPPAPSSTGASAPFGASGSGHRHRKAVEPGAGTSDLFASSPTGSDQRSSAAFGPSARAGGRRRRRDELDHGGDAGHGHPEGSPADRSDPAASDRVARQARPRTPLAGTAGEQHDSGRHRPAETTTADGRITGAAAFRGRSAAGARHAGAGGNSNRRPPTGEPDAANGSGARRDRTAGDGPSVRESGVTVAGANGGSRRSAHTTSGAAGPDDNDGRTTDANGRSAAVGAAATGDLGGRGRYSGAAGNERAHDSGVHRRLADGAARTRGDGLGPRSSGGAAQATEDRGVHGRSADAPARSRGADRGADGGADRLRADGVLGPDRDAGGPEPAPTADPRAGRGRSGERIEAAESAAGRQGHRGSADPAGGTASSASGVDAAGAGRGTPAKAERDDPPAAAADTHGRRPEDEPDLDKLGLAELLAGAMAAYRGL